MSVLLAMLLSPSVASAVRSVVSPSAVKAAAAASSSGSRAGDKFSNVAGLVSGDDGSGGTTTAGVPGAADDGTGTSSTGATPGSDSSDGASGAAGSSGSSASAGAGSGGDAGSAADSGITPTRNTDPAMRSYTAYDVLAEYTHDFTAFTQGLYWTPQNTLIESTGLKGHSNLREVEPETGDVTRQYDLPSTYFGEGCVPWGEKIIMLTWQEHTGFVFHDDGDEFSLESTFDFSTVKNEGWGITTDGTDLIMSDGSEWLFFWDPVTFEERRRVQVLDPFTGNPVKRLNELEYVKGEVLANIWYDNHVARIDPLDGRLIGLVDFTALHPPSARPRGEDVLNGIAYDAMTDVLWMTGKKWHKMFKVRLNEGAMDPPFPAVGPDARAVAEVRLQERRLEARKAGRRKVKRRHRKEQ